MRLAITAAASAALFALVSWLIIEHWAYPRMLESLREFSAAGIPISTEAEHPVLRLWLPYFTISAAELAGAAVLTLPKLRDATLAIRTALLIGAIVLGWLIAVLAFVPPDITSVLLFSAPALLLLLLSWAVASPLALLRRRAPQDVPDSSRR